MATLKREADTRRVNTDRVSRSKQIIWFVGLWVVGVAVLAVLAYSLRWAVNFAYMG